MNKTDSHQLLQVIRHLYEVEQLSLKKISDRLGITRQAIHDRMVRNGISRRPSITPLIKVDSYMLHRLYEDERLPVYKVAEAIGVSHFVIERELKRHGIERRPKHSEKRRPSVIDGLAIGDSIVLQHPMELRLIFVILCNTMKSKRTIASAFLLTIFLVASVVAQVPFLPKPGDPPQIVKQRSFGGGYSECEVGWDLYRCHDTIDLLTFTKIAAQSQERSQWCWVAGISMVFAQQGHPVNQARIVQDAYGFIDNVPAQTGMRISKEVAKDWVDDKGKKFRSAIIAQWEISSNIINGQVPTQLPTFSVLDLTPEIASNRPVIMGLRGHVVIIVGLKWERTPQGPKFNAIEIFDPWPINGGFKSIPGDALGEVQYIAAVRVSDYMFR